MIAALRGILEERGSTEVIVDVNGVGYRAFMSQQSLEALPPMGEPVKLRVRTVVREDAFELYAFTTEAEEELFLLLTSVSHVGPKLALSALSGMAPAELAHAISKGEVARLTKLNGVGKKTAERLVLELKEKVAPLAKGASPASVRAQGIARAKEQSDLVGALLNLGYKGAQAEAVAARATEKLGADAKLEELIREALRAARG